MGVELGGRLRVVGLEERELAAQVRELRQLMGRGSRPVGVWSLHLLVLLVLLLLLKATCCWRYGHRDWNLELDGRRARLAAQLGRAVGVRAGGQVAARHRLAA